MSRAVPTARGPALRQPGSAVESWAARRRPYLDNLKVLLIAAIIAIHAVLGYAGTIQVWSYTEVREATLSPVTEGVLLVLITPFGLFVITLLFLVAGLLAEPSLERKGPRGFARDRLLRLGVPFVLTVGLIQPVVIYALEHPLGAATGSYWYEFLGAEGQIDTGPLWFVGVLLIFSLGYAGWVALRGHPGPVRHPTDERQLLLIVAVAVPASFAIRLVYPYGGEAGFSDLNFWQWPACLALFGVGVHAAREGWLGAVPDRLFRRCRLVALVGVGAMAAWLTIAGFRDLIDAMMGGWHWAALVFSLIEVTLTVYGSIWLLGAAQRHLDRAWMPPALRRSAFGAFIVQTPVLIGLALALRPVGAPAELKALLVAAGGVVVSFALAWLLIRWVPLISRVL